MKHPVLRPVAISTAALALCLPGAPLQAQSITVVSWGGSYARASQEAYHKPFTEETGIEIRLEDYNGGLAQIRAQVESGVVYWDVVDLELADAVRGCDEGLFELIDLADLPPGADGSSPGEDYYPDTLSECGAGTLFYSTVYAFNSEVISGETPATIDDFFDLQRFPGRRGMRRSPSVNLEFALMADGVAMEDVYAVMDTEEGLARAFRKLDTIKDQIVWWEAGAQPPQMLADGEVVMSTAYNGRIFNAQVLENQPFTIVWDGQVLDSGPMGIVAGTPRLAEALEFVNFVARPESMARISQYIAYSPVRRSAEALISTHLETGVEMRPHMPNTPEHTRRALRNDWAWWSDNGDEMNERFIVWLSQ
ncbi:MAG: ABC transporter substrate-binding protein [Proteobacteria bacterium]|nr:ABC transporter substrate-binding protein [Pseudomonadota bacterium]MYJ94669.1 ABC transporter substrate-binding protein [Pseudomonadota bacterium]